MPSACGSSPASPTSQKRDVGYSIRAARSLVVSGVLQAGAGLAVAQAFEFVEQLGVVDGRADDIRSAGPLAEVDTAASVGAEGHILTASEHECAAGGTAQRFGFRLGHKFILGRHPQPVRYRPPPP